MKKICLVIHSLQPGGTERVMSELATHFSLNKNTEVHLIIYGKSREIFYDISDCVTIHTPDFKFNNKMRTLSSLRTLLFLRKKVKLLKPDAVLSLGEYWNSFVMISLLGLNYPIYLSDRCKPDKNLGNWHELLRAWLYPKASGLIAQTEIAKDIFLERNLNKNIDVIGNPIKRIGNEKEDLGKENIILAVGRLIESKNHDRLISIFNRLNRDDWKLVIVGGNALRQDGMSRLKHLIGKHNLQNSVELTGNVENVEEYYLKSRIFAFTSSSEGFPNVVGEAMSAGLPVVTYDCVAGPSDLIDDGGNGFLVPLFDDESFKEKLLILMEDEEMRSRMGKASRNLIKKYSTEFISEQFYSFILESK